MNTSFGFLSIKYYNDTKINLRAILVREKNIFHEVLKKKGRLAKQQRLTFPRSIFIDGSRHAVNLNPVTIRVLKKNLFNAICPNVDFMRIALPVRIRDAHGVQCFDKSIEV